MSEGDPFTSSLSEQATPDEDELARIRREKARPAPAAPVRKERGKRGLHRLFRSRPAVLLCLLAVGAVSGYVVSNSEVYQDWQLARLPLISHLETHIEQLEKTLGG